jgi:hypothetical protein
MVSSHSRKALASAERSLFNSGIHSRRFSSRGPARAATHVQFFGESFRVDRLVGGKQPDIDPCDIPHSRHAHPSRCTVPSTRRLAASPSLRRVLLISQHEDVQRFREAPTFVVSGAYVVAHRRLDPLMLIRISGSQSESGVRNDESLQRGSRIGGNLLVR